MLTDYTAKNDKFIRSDKMTQESIYCYIFETDAELYIYIFNNPAEILLSL